MDDPIPESIKKFTDLLHQLIVKSQERFENQLSYISAGALVLSVGFIKDIIKDIDLADYKWMLFWGWVLLTLTLLINCISHIVGYLKMMKSVNELENYNAKTYNPQKLVKRHRAIGILNIVTAVTLVGGIFFIVLFVYLNLL